MGPLKPTIEGAHSLMFLMFGIARRWLPVLALLLFACAGRPQGPVARTAPSSGIDAVSSETAASQLRAAHQAHRSELKPISERLDRDLDLAQPSLAVLQEDIRQRAGIERAYQTGLRKISVPTDAMPLLQDLLLKEALLIESLDEVGAVSTLSEFDEAFDRALDRADERLLAEDSLFRALRLPGLLTAGEPAPPADGRVLLEEDFSDVASGWDEVSDTRFSLKYTDGQYQVRSTEAGRTVLADTRENTSSGAESRLASLENVTVEVDAVKENNSTARFGLICYSNITKGDAYLGLVDTHGGWSIGKLSQFSFAGLAGPAPPSDAIYPARALNHLRLDCRRDGAGVVVILYANGQRIGEANDTKALTPGAVGFAAANFRGRCCSSVLFDDLLVRSTDDS